MTEMYAKDPWVICIRISFLSGALYDFNFTDSSCTLHFSPSVQRTNFHVLIVEHRHGRRCCCCCCSACYCDTVIQPVALLAIFNDKP